MMDIKHMVRDRHRLATGKANDRILDNARRLAGTGKPIVFRTPVVPTVNDTEEQIADIAAFIRTLIDQRTDASALPTDRAHIRYELLTFHRLASDKYRSLGREYRAATLEPLQKGRMQALADVAAQLGVDTVVR
jgi:pyruvate formate lyase activating enzyme